MAGGVGGARFGTMTPVSLCLGFVIESSVCRAAGRRAADGWEGGDSGGVIRVITDARPG